MFQGYPGRGKTDRQLQASTGLLYDTLQRYDPEHRLLDQARREVMEEQLDIRRLRELLERVATQQLVLMTPERFTPNDQAPCLEKIQQSRQPLKIPTAVPGGSRRWSATMTCTRWVVG